MEKGTTKKKAHEELRDVEDRVNKRTYIPESEVPLFHQVAEDWIEFKRPNLRESTWEVYRGHVKNHFGELDCVRIDRITTSRVEKFITSRQVEGMNISTLRKVLVTLGQILGYAVRHGYIYHNPLRDAERPGGRSRQRKRED
jgi:site-specific recombinase XerD